jgi:hypothetical protein
LNFATFWAVGPSSMVTDYEQQVTSNRCVDELNSSFSHDMTHDISFNGCWLLQAHLETWFFFLSNINYHDQIQMCSFCETFV